MNRKEILDTIKLLSAGQGFYGRLYNFLTNGSEEAENALDELEEQQFADAVDMVLFIEG